VKDLVSRERAVTLEILVHLIEVERRRLHVGLGYASMFDYCTRHLGYSSSAASRRIQAARCIRDYPVVHELLERNEVNLVTISLIASILPTENARDLLGKIRGKSQREVEAIAAAYRPPVSMRDRATPVRVAVPAQSAHPLSSTRGEHTPTAGSEKRPNATAAGCAGGQSQAGTAAGGSAAGPLQAPPMTQAQLQATPQPPSTHAAAAKVPLEDKFFVKFLASKSFMTKLERAQALLSNTNRNLSYEFVLETALDEFLKDHDPEERNKRREERRGKAEAKTKSGDQPGSGSVDGPLSSSERAGSGGGDDPSCECDRAGGGQADGQAVSTAKAGSGQADDPLFRRWIGGLPAARVQTKQESSRRIPAGTRDAVFARDKGRCTYIGSNGKRCAAVHNLQIDHVIPYARGGGNALDNLRLLCERHNKHEAERVLGANMVGRFRRKE
jgi:hypothetical protein